VTVFFYSNTVTGRLVLHKGDHGNLNASHRIAQISLGNLSVSLSRRRTGVSEDFLDEVDIRGLPVEPGAERVAQAVDGVTVLDPSRPEPLPKP